MFESVNNRHTPPVLSRRSPIEVQGVFSIYGISRLSPPYNTMTIGLLYTRCIYNDLYKTKINVYFSATRNGSLRDISRKSTVNPKFLNFCSIFSIEELNFLIDDFSFVSRGGCISTKTV